MISKSPHIIIDEIITGLKSIFPHVQDITLENWQRFISPTPNLEQGHLAVACFTLAKQLKTSPTHIAQQLCEELPVLIEKSLPSLITKMQATGPYANIFWNCKELFSIIEQNHEIRPLFSSPPKTMIEYSQPNTHKEMHVGHMRNLCLGHAMVNIYRACGIETLAVTYPGDVGTHVAKCLWYLKHHCPENILEEKDKTLTTAQKGAWLGSLYTKGHLLLEQQRQSEKETQNKQQLTEILSQIKNQSGEFYQLWKLTRQWSIAQMQELYNWTSVEFDQWFFESEVDAPSLQLVDEYLKRGIFKVDQGAVGIDLSEDKLGFCLLRKSDGNGLYATKDLALAKVKFENFAIEKNIYIVDQRQSHHFKQVFKTLEKMGFPQASHCSHLSYDFVELPSGPMSSRAGNIIPIETLIQQMQQVIIDKFLSRYQNDWDDQEISHTAHLIADGAIKYGMTKIDGQKKIIFDLNQWTSLEGNTGPYLQYSYARVQSLLRKFPNSQKNALSYKTEFGKHPTEKALIIAMLNFPATLQQCVLKNTPHLLANYLYELAQNFSSFYAACTIQNAATELQEQRLILCKSFARTMKNGLELLGIRCPERM